MRWLRPRAVLSPGGCLPRTRIRSGNQRRAGARAGRSILTTSSLSAPPLQHRKQRRDALTDRRRRSESPLHRTTDGSAVIPAATTIASTRRPANRRSGSTNPIQAGHPNVIGNLVGPISAASTAASWRRTSNVPALITPPPIGARHLIVNLLHDYHPRRSV